MKKAVFIDKDGTLIKDIPYNTNPKLIDLLPGALESLQSFKAAGFKIVVISNQSGIARGKFDEADLGKVVDRINKLLAKAHIKLDGFYYCPHLPDGSIAKYSINCACRKPQPGLLIRAAQDLKIDLEKSWMIGDILIDIEAGNRAGCQTILLDSGGETEWYETAQNRPRFICQNWRDVKKIILPAFSQERRSYINGRIHYEI